MGDDTLQQARSTIADRRGELRGWRPLVVGDIAVTALQVLGMARGAQGIVGMRAVVAARSEETFASRGCAVAERLLRARAVLEDDESLEIESLGPWHPGDVTATGFLAWQWRWLVFHVPERRLPAIAGLATDTVPRP